MALPGKTVADFKEAESLLCEKNNNSGNTLPNVVNGFDVNSFLKKTLSNFVLDEVDEILKVDNLAIAREANNAAAESDDLIRIQPSSNLFEPVQRCCDSEHSDAFGCANCPTKHVKVKHKYGSHKHRSSSRHLIDSGGGTSSGRSHKRSRTKSWSSHRSRKDVYKTSLLCAYCGSNVAPKSGLYCRDCILLLRNSAEIQRLLLEESFPSGQENTDSSWNISLSLNEGGLIYMDPASSMHSEISSLAANNADLEIASFHQRETACSAYHPYNKSLRRASPDCSSKGSFDSKGSNKPLCRICHLPGEKDDRLTSPCKCSGTMKNVHISCLVKWLEISTKKMFASPRCELCGYAYQTNSCCCSHNVHFPRCSARDRVLHLLFVLMMIVMIGCASLSIMYLAAERGSKSRISMSFEDIVVICCAVLFFCSFFICVYAQYRAEATIFTLLFRCWLINKLWRIKNYEATKLPNVVQRH